MECLGRFCLNQKLFEVSQVPLVVVGEFDGSAVSHAMPTVLTVTRPLAKDCFQPVPADEAGENKFLRSMPAVGTKPTVKFPD